MASPIKPWESRSNSQSFDVPPCCRKPTVRIPGAGRPMTDDRRVSNTPPPLPSRRENGSSYGQGYNQGYGGSSLYGMGSYGGYGGGMGYGGIFIYFDLNSVYPFTVKLKYPLCAN